MNISNRRRASQDVEKVQSVPVEKILSDPRPDGKERPWREKKMRTLDLAASFGRLGEQARSGRIYGCGTYLEFKKSLESGMKQLIAANFCRERLCPMCAWRRSLRGAYVLSSVMDEVEKEHGRLIPLFMTLTVRNCPGTVADLTQSLDMVFEGWKRLLQVKRAKSVVKGWFRALEITYNREAGTFHPHIHAVVYVDKSYFQASGRGSYIKTVEWVQLWRQSCRLNYDPICDTRRVKNDKQRKHINELSKYTVKDSDFITADNVLMDRLVSVLSKALKRRRLNAFGGILKQIAAGLRMDKEDKEDLICVGNGTIRADVAVEFERYFWHVGVGQFLIVN